MDDEEFKPDPGADDADDVYVPGADEADHGAARRTTPRTPTPARTTSSWAREPGRRLGALTFHIIPGVTSRLPHTSNFIRYRFFIYD